MGADTTGTGDLRRHRNFEAGWADIYKNLRASLRADKPWKEFETENKENISFMALTL